MTMQPLMRVGTKGIRVQLPRSTRVALRMGDLQNSSFGRQKGDANRDKYIPIIVPVSVCQRRIVPIHETGHDQDILS